MLQFDEYKVKLNNLRPELDELDQALGLETAIREVEMLESESASDGFWDNLEKAQKVQQRVKQLRDKIEGQQKRKTQWDDLMTLCELGNEAEDETLVPEVEEGFAKLEAEIEEAKLSTLLTGEYDGSNAILTFHAGAGGDNEATVANVVKQAVDTFGGIQVLINNAQASASGVPLAEHTTEQFDLAIYSGLYAAFYYMKDCYPYLAESHGSVINFASGAGLFGNFGQSAYAAAKEGIRGMSRVAATEWGKDGINVNVVCPLAWTAKLEQFRDAYPDAFKANVKMPPMGHYGNAETEIGRVCVQLAMPDFKYMSGETLTLEGGMGQRP